MKNSKLILICFGFLINSLVFATCLNHIGEICDRFPYKLGQKSYEGLLGDGGYTLLVLDIDKGYIPHRTYTGNVFNKCLFT